MAKTAHCFVTFLFSTCWMVLITSVPAEPASSADLAWPVVTRTNRPWAYWWWMGSAVDRTNLVREFARYKEGGLGGMHIVPIYGAKGWETNYIEYLTPRWLQMLSFTVGEAARFDLGVDMTLGTGWCFGGPTVSDQDANANVVVNTYNVTSGSRLTNRFEKASTQALVAFAANGRNVDLTDRVRAQGVVDWTAEGDDWRVYAVSQKPSGNPVDRAAPGGEGPMLNPFFPEAIQHYLARFNRAFGDYRGPMPRSLYHDSYEYVANWAPDLFAQFEQRRGYRLQSHLEKFFGKTPDDTAARLKCDYRETLSDLMVEQFNPAWIGWAHNHGELTRNQAHGSPGNLLDLYAAADIPETEMFNRDRDMLVSKFATSAAHVAGHPLASSETGTWMKEHFTEKLSDMKALVDELFVSGVNHVFYHGTCYSPDEAGWPGWLFYASTEMNPRNSIWHDVPALNGYIARCQSVLQRGRPDNDLLVYWPIYDYWHAAEGMERACSVHHREWLRGQRIGAVAQSLWDRGFTFDYVSDRQLARTTACGGAAVVPGGAYRAVIVPACEHIPLPTLHHLLELAQGGACLIFDEHLPTDVPGLARLEERRAELKKLLAPLAEGSTGGNLREVAVGQGRIFIGDVAAALGQAAVARESMVDRQDLLFVRRSWEGGHHYLVVNKGTEPIERWVPLAAQSLGVALMDPMSGRLGLGRIRPTGQNQTEVYLQLEPGASLLLRTFTQRRPEGPAWTYLKPAGPPVELTGTWNVKFIAGGPALPKSLTTTRLGSWTELGDSEAQRFAGTAAYSLVFDLPPGLKTLKPNAPVLIDLGNVCQSARVRLNNQDLGTVFMPPFRVVAKSLKPKNNRLEVDVTNVSANRIRDLDRRGVKWKNFHNINFVSMDYKPFDASNWPLTPSGLLGPVTLRGAEARTDLAATSDSKNPQLAPEAAATLALWLFDEPQYLNATLTDATQNFYDLRLFPAGQLVPGRFGTAIGRRSPAPGQAVSFAEDCNGFANDWEGSLKDRPAKAPARLIAALGQGDWTWEFWVKFSHPPTFDACLIDAGEGVFTCTLRPADGGFSIESVLAGLRVLAPCGKQVWNGKWHHVAFTYSKTRKSLRSFLDGAPQGASREIHAQPPASPETTFLKTCRPGLLGQVFGNPDFTRPDVQQISPQLDFDLGASRGLDWSERWQGFLRAPVSGRLALRAKTPDQVRLRVAQENVVNTTGTTPFSGGLEVAKGKYYPLELEYIHRGPQARLQLLWSWDGSPEEVVPASAFFHSVTNLEPRFDLALLSDQLGERPSDACLDEMRVSSQVRYEDRFHVPETFSRHAARVSDRAASPALPLLFDSASGGAPVKLAGRKHLFLDDALLAERERVVFAQSDPVRIENTTLRGLGDACVLDTGEQINLYMGGWMGGVGLHQSRDGLKFEEPTTVWPLPGQANFFIDARPGIPAAERFKGIAFIMTRGLYGLSSPDGLVWSRNENMLLPFDCGGGVEPYWDDQRGRYVCHIRHEGYYARHETGPGRISARAESDDFYAPWPFAPDPQPVPRKAFTLPALWKELPYGFVPNPSGEVYRSRAIKYPWAPDAYVSFVWRFQPKTAEHEETTQTELGISRNGRDWRFFGTTPAYLPFGMKLPNGDSARFAACSLGLVRRGDEIWQYAEVRGTVHQGGDSKVIRLTRRLDGIVSLQAGAETGSVLTRPLVFEGSGLILNAAVRGSLRAELQDERGKPLPGLALIDCQPICADSTRVVVNWRDAENLKRAAGRTVRVRFEMRDANLFAMQFVP
jgi:hypothetical protein